MAETTGPRTVQDPATVVGAPRISAQERRRRWRLLLGEAAQERCGTLTGDDLKIDAALGQVYRERDAAGGGGRSGGSRSAGLAASAPAVTRWLGDIRTYFPTRVVEVLQRDAMTRLGLTRLLLEPEVLESVEPNVGLVGTLVSLKNQIPEQTKATARQVVRTVVEQIEERIATRTRSAVTGALNRAARTHRPRHADIDWNATIRANLAHYQPGHRTVIPERLVGYTRRRQTFHKEVVLAVDQSGSMAESVVYAAVFGAVLASMRALKTSVVVFDTEVVDLTGQLSDPVDLLFGVQLGGGTDINRALAYAQGLLTRPRDSIFVLISDLYEGGIAEEMLRRMGRMKADGVQVVALLALGDQGAPAYHREHAAALTHLGIPAFACTPDAFPDLLAAALTGSDLLGWVERTTGGA